MARFLESEKEAHINFAGFPNIRADGFFRMGSSLYTVAVPIVFDQEIHVHYGQFYVQSRPDFFVGLIESLGGQANGLCGAAVPGLLFLITGLHTGHTSVTVEMPGAPTPIGDEWEDVVEASFRLTRAKVFLLQWGGERAGVLPLAPIDYRVRYSATGMDQARGRRHAARRGAAARPIPAAVMACSARPGRGHPRDQPVRDLLACPRPLVAIATHSGGASGGQTAGTGDQAAG